VLRQAVFADKDFLIGCLPPPDLRIVQRLKKAVRSVQKRQKGFIRQWHHRDQRLESLLKRGFVPAPSSTTLQRGGTSQGKRVRNKYTNQRMQEQHRGSAGPKVTTIRHDGSQHVPQPTVPVLQRHANLGTEPGRSRSDANFVRRWMRLCRNNFRTEVSDTRNLMCLGVSD